jgi:hypothetical protein
MLSADDLFFLPRLIPTPMAFVGSQFAGERQMRGHWFKGSSISPCVRRPPASPSYSNTAPSFEPDEEDEEEPEEDPEPLC